MVLDIIGMEALIHRQDLRIRSHVTNNGILSRMGRYGMGV